MKKRFWALLMVVMMVLTMLPMETLASNPGRLVVCKAVVDEDGDYVRDENGGVVPDTSTAMERITLCPDGYEANNIFCFVDGNGNITQITDHENLSYDDATVFNVLGDGTVGVSASGKTAGTVYTATYTPGDGQTYDFIVSVVNYPMINYYSDAACATQIADYQITDSGSNVFYLKAVDPSWKITEITSNNGIDAVEYASVSLDSTTGIATITITDTTLGGMPNYPYMYKYSLSNGVDSLKDIPSSVSIFAGNNDSTTTNPPFGFAYPGIDDNNNIMEDVSAPINNYLYMTAGTSQEVFFYWVNADDSRVNLTKNDLSADAGITIEDVNGITNAVRVTADANASGMKMISYTTSEGNYTVTVDIGSMPGPGPGDIMGDPNATFCTYDESTSTYVPITNDTFSVTEEEKVFYLKLDAGWTISNITLEEPLKEIATWESLQGSNNIARITITEAPELNSGLWYSLKYSATHDTYNPVSDMYASIHLENNMPMLMYQYTGYQMDSDGMGIPVIEPENPLSTTLEESGIQGEPALVFYYVANGQKSIVTADQLTGSNGISLKAHEANAQITSVSFSKFGEGTISYTTNGKTYSVKTNVQLPEFGFYTTNYASEDTYINEFSIKEGTETIYYIARDGWKFTSADIDSDFKTFADATVDENHPEVIIIQFKDFPAENWDYQISYSAERTMNNESKSDFEYIYLYDGNPSVKYCFVYTDQNGNLMEEDRLNNSYEENGIGDMFERSMYFYMIENGVKTKIPVSELTVADETVFKLVADANNPYLAKVSFKKYGETKITYTKNDKTYEIPVAASLPPVGFYSSDVASYATYISEFTVTDNANTYYCIARDNWKFNRFELDQNLSGIATVEMNAAKNVAKITITGTPENDFYYGINIVATDGSNENISSVYGIPLYNDKTSFAFCRPQFENGQFVGLGDYQYQWSTSLGYSEPVWFVLEKDGNYEVIDFDDLTITGDSILKLEEIPVDDTSDETLVYMEAIGWGTATITYTHTDGKEYSIKVISEVADTGFFKEPAKTRDNWLVHEYTVDNEKNELFFMIPQELQITNIQPVGECADKVRVSISKDKTYATITVLGESDDFWLSLDYTMGASVCRCGDDCRNSNCAMDCNCPYCRPLSTNCGIMIINEMCDHENTVVENYVAPTCTKDGFSGKVRCTDCDDTLDNGKTLKALGHDTEVVGKKAPTCTVDGYTGDTVCKTCEETVTKGQVIKATGHDTEVVGKKAETCTADGYTGDTVCEICEETITKGEVTKATGHDTKVVGRKAETCTADGYTGDTVCKTCEETVMKGTVINATGHAYKDMTCTVCGDKMIVTEKVEEVDTTKPVVEVTPVVKQEAADTASKEVMKVVEEILSENVSEEVKTAVSEETIKAIKEAVEAGAQITTEVVSNVVTEEQVKKEDVAEIKEVLGTEATVAQYLDLSVMIKAVAGNNVESELGTLNELSEPITFVIAIPENLEKVGRDFYILRVHEGVVDKLAVSKNMDGTYSFETDKFSTYALVYEDTAITTTESPKTGDVVMWVCSAVIIFSLGGVLVSRKRSAVR